MKELFDNYYNESFSQSKSQRLDLKTFELAAKKFKWNYQRFFAEMPRDAKILDFGCGIGQFLFFLQKEGFQNVTGIDISKSQIELALQMQSKVDFRHVVDPVSFLNQHLEEYDVITINDVLEHIERKQIISNLNAIYQSIKPGGIVIIKTVNAAYPLGFSQRYNDITHNSAFHEKSLTQLLRHVKFIKINCFQEEIGIYNFLFLLKKFFVIMIRFMIRFMIYFTESDWQRIISVNLIACGRKETNQK